jgi:hypothetical protein
VAGVPRPVNTSRATSAPRAGVAGTAAPAVVAPASNTGSTGSNETAWRGSPPVTSSHRPSHPVFAGLVGEAVCQMSIERKWLWSGFGYSIPRTIASRLALNSPANPVIPGLSPMCWSRCSTSCGWKARSPRASW